MSVTARTYVVAMFAVLGMALVIFLIFYWRNDPNLRTFPSAATPIVTALTYAVIVFYTAETYLLRKTSEAQVEAQIKPIVLFELSSESPVPGQTMSLKQPRLRNVGAGPALGITVSKIPGTNVEVEFQDVPMPLIEAKGELPVSFLISENGKYSGMSGQLSKLRDAIEKGQISSPVSLQVDFTSLSQKRYRATHQIIYDSQSKRVVTALLHLSEL